MFGLTIISKKLLESLQQNVNYYFEKSKNFNEMNRSLRNTIDSLTEKIKDNDKKYNTLSLKLARKCLRIKQLNIKIQRLSKGRSKRSLRKLKVVY
jgi:hypothetical protein